MIDKEHQTTQQAEVWGHIPLYACMDRSRHGGFQPCVLHIHASTWADLEPEHDAAGPRAISTHAHEYVHYLHSIGTTAGQLYLLANVIFLRLAVSGTDGNGHFLGAEALNETQRSELKGLLRFMQNLRAQKKIELSYITGYERLDFSPPRHIPACDSTFAKVDRLTVAASATQADGTVVTDEMDVGYSFVTEGVAYEVDREIRRLQGAGSLTALDAGINVYPYRAYGELIDAWVGRKTSVTERILIGNAALGSHEVGSTLRTACDAVRQSDHPVTEALNPILIDGLKYSQDTVANLRNVISTIGAGPTVMNAFSAYLQLVDRASDCRRRLLAPERLLIEAPLDAEGLRNVMGKLVDAMVLQHKPKAPSTAGTEANPEAKVQAELTIDWIGPGDVGQDLAQASHMATLQSAFHFNHLHHRADGVMVPTSSLGASCCPYKGACSVKVSEDDAALCASAPWKMFLDSEPGANVCWYAAGVKAVRRDEAATAPSTLEH